MAFAKISKFLRFILLGAAFIFILASAQGIIAIIDTDLGYEMGVFNDEITPDNVLMAYLPQFFMAIACLVMSIVCFIAYSRSKVKIRKEAQETYKSRWSSRRKFKLFLRIAGIILLALGVLVSIGKPIGGAILIVIGLPLLIISFIIRVRKHAESRHTNRIVEGNKITINYNNDTNPLSAMRDMAKIIQDAYNDGYYVFESFAGLNNGKECILIFSTPLSNKEIQQQYQRREKYYQTRGKNAHEMPWYFSSEVTIKYKQASHDETGTHTEKVPIYNYEIRKTYEIEKDPYSGIETGRKVVKEEKVRTTINHYELVTYRDYTTIYHFIDKDGKDLKMANGNVASLVTTSSFEIGREILKK